MSDESLTRIESLKRKMYSRKTEGLRGVREHELHEENIPVENDWKHEAPPPQFYPPPRRGIPPPLKFFLIFSVLFFIGAAAYSAYLFYGGGNIISPENIDIVIAGPVSIRGGEKLSLDVSIKNRNETALELTDLLVEYPEGTRSASNISEELPRYRDNLGTIEPGGEIKKTISAVLFGEERSNKTIKITLEYRLAGSNAIFYKENEYQITISSAPLSLLVDIPTEANSGQDISFTVNLNSNATEVVHNVLLKAEYPPGFNFKSASPLASYGNNIWKLGDVKPASRRSITVRGTLTGENEDAKIFHFETGIESGQDEKSIGTPFANLSQSVGIKRPFVGLSIALDGSTDNEVAVKSGKAIRVDIAYTNNLSIPVSGLAITLKLTGDALDRASVSPEQGFFRSVDNTVIWDSTTDKSLALVPPGEKGVVSVTLASRSGAGGIFSLKNPTISLSASVKGERSEGEGVPEEVTSSVKRLIKVDSDIQLGTKLLYFTGPFKNTGPIPPKVDRETTYTVTWTISNGSNDITDTLVKATLPPYTRFIEGTKPSLESVSFNNVGGVLTWEVGDLKAGTGFTMPPREVSFQISFVPSLNQIGQVPTLINIVTLSAQDRFTGTLLSTTKQVLTTRLSTDGGARFGDEIVVK